MATTDDLYLQNILKYHFKNPDLLHEALLGAGASLSKGLDGDPREEQRLALIGDALFSLDIADRWNQAGANTSMRPWVYSDQEQRIAQRCEDETLPPRYMGRVIILSEFAYSKQKSILASGAKDRVASWQIVPSLHVGERSGRWATSRFEAKHLQLQHELVGRVRGNADLNKGADKLASQSRSGEEASHRSVTANEALEAGRHTGAELLASFPWQA
jgi:hypothetical protein